MCFKVVIVNAVHCTIVFIKREEENRNKEEEKNVVEFGYNLNVVIIF